MSARGNLFGKLESLHGALDPDVNLWSYVALVGSGACLAKLKGDGSPELKRQLIEEVCGKFRGGSIRRLLGQARKHVEVVGKALALSGYRVKVCTVRALARVVIGTGGPFGVVPFEVGVSFDPVLNVPYLPGTALKGAFRHALVELVERYQGMSASQAERVAESYFGSGRSAGLVGVTDAYPVEPGIDGLLFEPDVVTPHYPGARDELEVEPSPVPFLAIARGVKFRFFVYYNKDVRVWEGDRIGAVRRLDWSSVGELTGYAVLEDDLGEALGRVRRGASGKAAQALPWLDGAVLYAFAKGVGAKTGVGYSRFEVVEYRPFRCEP